MNKKQKGHKAENDYADYFKSLNYPTQIAQRTSVFTGKFYVSKDNDFFNLFDIISISPLRVYMVQVKTNVNHVYGAIKKIKDFAFYNGNTDIVYQVVLKVARKGYVVWNIIYDPVSEFNEFKVYMNLKFDAVPKFDYSNKKEK
jgi:hypothetical protein